jgi:hypothetical protein
VEHERYIDDYGRDSAHRVNRIKLAPVIFLNEVRQFLQNDVRLTDVANFEALNVVNDKIVVQVD